MVERKNKEMRSKEVLVQCSGAGAGACNDMILFESK